ncbi:MAG: hypothetical protein ACJAWQ_002312, partial [Paraglaciecola sp.]
MAKRNLILGSVGLLLAFGSYQLLDTQMFDTQMFDTQMFDIEQMQDSKACTKPAGMAFIKGGTFTMGAGAV